MKKTIALIFGLIFTLYFSVFACAQNIDLKAKLQMQKEFEESIKQKYYPKGGVYYVWEKGNTVNVFYNQVGANEQLGLIDKTGKLITSLRYNRVWGFSEGLAKVEDKTDGFSGHEKYGFIDETGKVVIPLKYNDCSSFCEGLAWVMVQNEYGTLKYGFIDKSGNEVIAPQYDWISDFSNGLAKIGKFNTPKYVMKDGYETESLQYGFINKGGQIVIPLNNKYEHSENFHEGYCNVMINGKWGFINNAGNVVVNPIYDAIWGDCCFTNFSEGLAAVVKDDKWGFIDNTGKTIAS